mmetsp:Transcript_54751/g.159098  ORF Transcript_54751/g.159098 Transcript_54751/m.159098 type:complete len:382 (-) Transcript_54751:158-1303(-)
MTPWEWAPGWVFALALLSLWAYPLLQRMPIPYDDRTAEVVPAERLALMPGNEKGSKVPPDLTGPFAPNDRLKAARGLFVGVVDGSESVDVAPSGELRMFDKFGYLHRAFPSDSDGLSFKLIEGLPPLYIGPGFPLGLRSIDDGRALLVCDSLKGLLRVDIELGTIQILANRVTATGQPINFANSLDIADDGMIYFSSSTAGIVSRNQDGFYDVFRSCIYTLFASEASGQLFSYNPATREVVSLLQGLHFANGVALSSDGSFVAVAETFLARVRRYWLRGPKKGTSDVLVDRLPGYPDGLTRSRDGGFWVRQFFSHFGMSLLPLIEKKWGCVAKLDPSGQPVDILMDRDGEVVRSITAVAETADGRLFMGNLGGTGVHVVKL